MIIYNPLEKKKFEVFGRNSKPFYVHIIGTVKTTKYDFKLTPCNIELSWIFIKSFLFHMPFQLVKSVIMSISLFFIFYLPFSILVYLFKVAPPPTVDKVTRTSSFTPGSLKVTWTAAASPVNLNGDIKAYNIKYQVIAPEAHQNYTLVTKPDDGTNGDFVIDNLPPCSAVSIEVSLNNFAYFFVGNSFVLYTKHTVVKYVLRSNVPW